MRYESNGDIFERFTQSRGELAGCVGDGYKSIVRSWNPELPFELEQPLFDDAGCFGYVFAGEARLSTPHNDVVLAAGQYFSLPGPFRVTGGRGLIIEHHGARPLPCFGGPIEETGRLRYISGCTDTLVIAPVRRGDPCFNVLYFPPGIDQQVHTHPSVRVGMVARGEGECILADKVVPLHSGDMFVIHPNGLHGFRTGENSGMTVVAYHPDSDCGPEDENHPMINRTLVDGLSLGRNPSNR